MPLAKAIKMITQCKTVAAILVVLALTRIVGAEDDTVVEVSDGSHIDVTFSEPRGVQFNPLLRGWISTSARAVANYYERFPVDRLTLRVNIFDGHGIHGGQTFGWGGGQIRISVGKATSATELADDWMLTHEMIHLAF